MRNVGWIASVAIVALSIVTLIAGAQDDKLTLNDLPKAVQKTVKARFPEAKIRGVAKEKNEEGATVYEVEMTIKGKAVDIIVDGEGDIEVIEEEIDSDDLPKPVKDVASKTFPKGKITQAEKITDEDKKVTYEVLVKVGDKTPFEVLMAKDGKILKDGSKPAAKSEKKEEKDADDEKEEKGEKKKPKD
jgi:Putative beta-lactamase-inhibitor-like, PepSY-like